MTTTGTMQRPDFDIELTDNVNTIGIVVTDNAGKPDPTRFVTRPLDRMAVQTSVGESKFSDRVMPYRDVAQEDWSGGRGLAIFDDDASRYYDSQNVLPDKKGKLTLSGKVTTSKTFSSGYAKLFEYKRCLYAINVIDGASSVLWMNGDRGAADSNTGALTKLNDAAKTWTADEFIGATVLITAGPGSEETQPWRVITDNDATSLTVSPAWAVTHTTSTEYVIVGTEKWTQILSLGGHVTDFAVADQYIYFARGETASLNVLRYNEYNNAGTWTARNAAETVKAVRLMALRNEAENTTYLYGALNNNSPYKVTVWKMRVPVTWEALYKDIGEVAGTNVPWSDRIIANVTNTTVDGATKVDIAAAFTTGVAAVRNLATPIDVTYGNAIGMMVKSSVATAAGDLRLLMDDTDDLGRTYYSPQSVLISDSAQEPRIIRLPFAADGDVATAEYIQPGYYIYIGSPTVYSAVVVDIATANSVTNTLTVEYYNGLWTALTITDGTASGGKSFAVDGTITFTLPSDWTTATVNENNQYWIRLKFSAEVSLGTKINQITIYDNPLYQNPIQVTKTNLTTWTNLPDLIDGDAGTDDLIDWNVTPYLYVGSSDKFDEVKIAISAVTANTNTANIEYWNGSAWATPTNIVDGTFTTGTQLQSGSITFKTPSSWQPTIVNGSASMYWVRIVVSAASLMEITYTNITLRIRDNQRDPGGLALVKTAADPSYVLLGYLTDGDAATYESIYFDTDMYLYVGASIVFNDVYVDVKTANGAAATLSAEYFNGSLWTSVTITDGTAGSGKPLAVDGDITWSPENDWSKCVVNEVELYWIRFKVSAACSAAIYEMRYKRQNNINIQIPALAADVWTWVSIAITPTAYPIPNEAIIKSFGLHVQTDKGAQVVYIQGGIRLLYTYADTYEIKLEGMSSVNALAGYNDAEIKGTNVWAFSEDGAVQIQNDNSVIKLPIGELSELSTERTGQAWCVNSVYLYFALAGLRIEQYYNRTLNDIGPDGDDGMPVTRIGDITSLLSYPGRVFASVDAGSAGYSSILMWRNNAWFDLYVASAVDKRIYSTRHQEIRGKNVGRLWFSESNVVKWLCLTPDPGSSSDFQYASSGYLQMGRMYAGMQDVVKMWKSVKLFGTLSAALTVLVEYRVDRATSWTTLGTFDAEEEIAFAYPYPTGKCIEFKLTLATSSAASTPVVEAFVVNCYAMVPVKDEYSITTVLEDQYYYVDLNFDFRKALGTSDTSLAALTILRAWRDGAKPLIFRSRHNASDNVYVVLNSIVYVPLDRPGPELKNNQERYLLSLSLMVV